MLNGIINVYKEAGFTSHDVVAKMRGICKMKKIGHTGTLDPAATGVLPVCLGTGTRLCDMLTDKDKEYVAELLLGVVTDTQDTTGEVLERNEVRLSEEEIRQAMESFRGGYDQIPPMYSAIKVNGKKLYELARAGQEIEREARHVDLPEIEVLEIAIPVVKFRVVCSKGTYIRSLCGDIGNKLGCGGTMQSLVRTRVGGFALDRALTLSRIEQVRDQEGLESILFPVEKAFEDTVRYCIVPEYDRMLFNGNPIKPGWIAQHSPDTQGDGMRVRMCTSRGEFLGLYEYSEGKKLYCPVKMFLPDRA